MEIAINVSGSTQSFRTTLAGVTHENNDGTSRQKIIKGIKTSDELLLLREYENEHDKNAIAVYTKSNRKIGYIPAGDVRLAWHIDSGGKVSAKVVAITGGPGFLGLFLKSQRKHYGCLIEVEKTDPDWNMIAPLMEKSRVIEDLLAEALATEKSDPKKAIQQYTSIIDEIKALDGQGRAARCWRRARYPINRLSMLLDKVKDYQGARDSIEEYYLYDDQLGLTSADNRAIAARLDRLKNKLT